MNFLLNVLVWVVLLMTTAFVVGGVAALAGLLWREYRSD